MGSKKRRKALFIFIAFLSVVSVLYAGCSCGSEKNNYDNGITIEGTTETDQDQVTEIFGAKDIHVKAGTKESDISVSATAEKNGVSVPVYIDLSSANLAEKGIYDVTYHSNDIKIVKKIYVYSEPSFVFESGQDGENLQINYLQALSGELYRGVEGKDCFGNKLDVVISDDGGLINKDGSFNCLSDYQRITLSVTDMAGQSLRLFKTVKITMKEPEFELLPSELDVAEEKFSFEISSNSKNEFLGVSLNGSVLSPNKLLQNDNGVISIPAECFEEYDPGEKVVMRVITCEGHYDNVVSIVDKMPISFSDEDLKNFVMKKQVSEEPVVIPQIKLLNSRQRVTPVYKVVKKSGGKVLTITDGKVIFPYETERGCEWTIDIALRNGESLSYDVSSYYDIGLEESEIYSPYNEFSIDVKQGYSLKSLRVYNNDLPLLFYDVAENNPEQFKKEIQSLNTKYIYDLEAKTEKNGKPYVQKVSFRVVKNGFGILGSEKDLNDGNVYARSYADLNYITGETCGRSGFVNWKGKNGNSYAQNARINFNASIASDIKKGGYLYFDIYIQDTDLYFYYTIKDSKDKNADWYLWRSGSADSEAYKNFEENIRFYDENGNAIKGDVLKNVTNTERWITVEIKLSENFGVTEYNGLSVYPIESLYGHTVYLSYIRYSSSSLYSDDTENPIYNPSGRDVIITDVWTDLKEIW